jgi:hypothetical protein
MIVKGRSLDDGSNIPEGRLTLSRQVVPQHRNGASAGLHQAEQHADGGAFACAVLAQKPKEVTAPDLKVDLVDCCTLVKAFREISCFQDDRHGDCGMRLQTADLRTGTYSKI